MYFVQQIFFLKWKIFCLFNRRFTSLDYFNSTYGLILPNMYIYRVFCLLLVDKILKLCFFLGRRGLSAVILAQVCYYFRWSNIPKPLHTLSLNSTHYARQCSPQGALGKETTLMRFLCLCRNLTKSKRENNKSRRSSRACV